MIIPSIVPGAVAPSENNLEVESAAGEPFESVDFSNLLASLVAAVRQTASSAESAPDATVDSAPSVSENDQVSQESDQSALDPSAILAFLAPFSPTVATVAALEPTTAGDSETVAIVVARFTEAVKSGTDHAVDSDAGNFQPVHAAQFSLPLEPLAAAAVLVQDVDGKNDPLSFANEAGQPQDDNGAGLNAKAPLSDVAVAVEIAVPIDTAVSEHSESSQSGELSSGIVEPSLVQDKMKPANVLDSVASANDSPGTAPKKFRSRESERGVKPAERQTVEDSESFALESPAIEEKAQQVRPSADSQSSFADRHEESSADRSQFKRREILADPQDARLQRLVPMPADNAPAKLLPANVAAENSNKPAWQPVVERVGEEIVRQLRIGERQAVIHLEPPELGKIQIDLRVEGGQIHARIVAEEQGTKALLESRLTELRQALEVGQVDLANLQVEQQNVSSGGAQWEQTFNDGPRQGHGQGQDDSGFADRSANDEPPRESPQRPASDPGRISMWA